MKQFLVNNIAVELVHENIDHTIKEKVNGLGRDDKEDAFFVGDMGDIVRKCNLWMQELPRVEPHYAVKCNSDPVVVSVLAKMGIGFDCASKSEIQQVIEMGVEPSRIVYANPCKQASHIRFAAKCSVSMMTFDNEVELHKIKQLYPNAECILRILPPDETKSQCQLGMKYGCHPKQAKNLLQVAKKLELNVIGISFHVGSGCWDASAFSKAVASARVVFDIGVHEGFNFQLLDIGGGFPGQPTAKITFQEICEVLRPALDTYFPKESGVRIISEPGRFFVSSAFSLAVNVIAKRVVPRDAKFDDKEDIEEVTGNDEPQFMYYVNDGVYGSFNCLLYDHAEVFPKPLKKGTNELAYVSSIWGPTCDGLDCIKEKYLMPELDVGDWMVFHDMGAYTMCAASAFNGMPIPSCYYTSKDHYWTQLNINFKCGPKGNTCKMEKIQSQSDCTITDFPKSYILRNPSM